jgi:hypothetical protein
MSWTVVVRMGGIGAAAALLVAGPVSGQTGRGGAGTLMLHEIDAQAMWWGALSWGGAEGAAVTGAPAGSFDDQKRLELLDRLKVLSRSGVYVEINGAEPAEVRVRSWDGGVTRIRLTHPTGRARGGLSVRQPADGHVPVLFVMNNEQREIVIDAAHWLEHVTLVVNGRVVLDGVRVERNED